MVLVCISLTVIHVHSLAICVLWIYWVGQKVHLHFSVTSYGKTQKTFLANPVHVGSCLLPTFYFIWIVCFLLLSLEFYLLDISPLSDMWFVNFFFPVCSLSLHPLNRVFYRAKSFNFDKVLTF